MGSDHKQKHKKNKHKSKDKKHRSKEKRRPRHQASSDSGTDSDGGRVGVNEQLAMGRAAARATREILAYNYELRRDLRELVRQLDSGGALDISGIPDVFLLERLTVLFNNLPQLRRNTAGQFRRRSDDSARVLAFIAPILDETPASLATYSLTAAQPAAQPPLEASPAAATVPGRAGVEQAPAAESEGSEGSPAAGRPRVIGPAAGPPAVAAEQVERLVAGSSDSEGEEGAAAAGGKRVLGPAMPPPDVLAAAAAMAPAYEEAEAEAEDDIFVVGPPPPELEEEMDLASMDERTAEVARVLKVLRDHATSTSAGGAVPPTVSAALAPPDPYTVLGADPSMPAGAIKKRYWRLSLLIHPDKCSHEQAPTAFQAVSIAAAELQDEAGRAAADERRQEAALRRAAAEHVAQLERQRQWRLAKGEATAEDLKGPVRAGGLARDTWMTDLPAEVALSQAPPQGSTTAFSAKGIRARGDTSAWTQTPQQRALQLEGGGGSGGAGAALLMGGGEDAKAHRTAAVVDAYNAGTRGKSLLDVHLERQAGKKQKKEKEKKKKEQDKGSKKRKGGAGEEGGGEGAEGWDRAAHPWRPFDRERDLGIAPATAGNPQELLKSMPALKSRFGGSQSGQRSFL